MLDGQDVDQLISLIDLVEHHIRVSGNDQPPHFTFITLTDQRIGFECLGGCHAPAAQKRSSFDAKFFPDLLSGYPLPCIKLRLALCDGFTHMRIMPRFWRGCEVICDPCCAVFFDRLKFHTLIVSHRQLRFQRLRARPARVALWTGRNGSLPPCPFKW
jgi:hypothetical protein